MLTENQEQLIKAGALLSLAIARYILKDKEHPINDHELTEIKEYMNYMNSLLNKPKE
jgi:hypothetical protein